MPKLNLGNHVVEAESVEEAAEIIRLIANLNLKACGDAQTKEFAVCIRTDEDWTAVADGPGGAFECAVLAASIATANPSLTTGVFSRCEDGSHDGPHLVFGSPAVALAAWILDSGDDFKALAHGAMTSVVRNAKRITFMSTPIVVPKNATEH